MITKQITVKELRELYYAGTHTIEIDTPDGFQSIGAWFDKGELDMVSVHTPSYSTTCAVNHMLQLEDESWVLASELEPGASIITKTGIEPVLSVVPASPAECYDFEVLHENHRYYGDGLSSHNSGKSYIASGNVIKHAQEQGIFVVLIDTENALDEAWLQPLGVDTSEDKLLKLNMAMIDDVAKTISLFMKDYKAMSDEDRPKILFVIDSLGMLMTPTETDQFNKGDMKGDMGRKAKALKALVTNCVNMFGNYNVGLLATNHTYASQDMFDPDDKISGGCLTAGHRVMMADGTAKNIEDIKVGDVVCTLHNDVEVTETFEFTDKEVFELELEDGTVLQATGEHKFLVQQPDSTNVWKTVFELTENDSILSVV